MNKIKSNKISCISFFTVYFQYIVCQYLILRGILSHLGECVIFVIRNTDCGITVNLPEINILHYISIFSNI